MVLKQEIKKDQIAEQGSHTSRFYCMWNEYMWTSAINSQQPH